MNSVPARTGPVFSCPRAGKLSCVAGAAVRTWEAVRVRRRDLIGRPVLELGSGRYLGEAREVLVDLSSATVVGIVVQRGRWVHSTWILPLESVLSCGDGAITVESEDALIPRTEYRQRRGSGEHQLVGKRVLDEGGRDLGTLDDIFFDPATCVVTGYQISGGVIQDLLEGKRSIPAVPLMLGYDAVVIAERSGFLTRPPDDAAGSGAGEAPDAAATASDDIRGEGAG